MTAPAEKRQQPPDEYNLAALRTEAAVYGFKDLLYFPDIPTTMTVVRDHALMNDRANPLSVLANHQTNGVGRDETKQWHDISGSSILLSAYIPLAGDEQGAPPTAEFADLVALGVCCALEKTSAQPLIKAPNDIVCDGKKISGILVQNVYDEKNLYKGVILGVGINVHYADEELTTYPTDYGATSVDFVTKKFNARQPLVVDILRGIWTASAEAVILAKSTDVQREQNALWQKYSYLLGKNVVVSEKDTILAEGKVVQTEIGNGIVVHIKNGKLVPITIFDTNTKVRLQQ